MYLTNILCSTVLILIKTELIKNSHKSVDPDPGTQLVVTGCKSLAQSLAQEFALRLMKFYLIFIYLKS